MYVLFQDQVFQLPLWLLQLLLLLLLPQPLLPLQPHQLQLSHKLQLPHHLQVELLQPHLHPQYPAVLLLHLSLG